MKKVLTFRSFTFFAINISLVILSSISVFAGESVQITTARSFISSLTKKDMKKVISYTPKSEANYFGAYPFKETPIISDPIVRGSYAIFKWSGISKANPTITTGYILLRRKSTTWLYRQVYFKLDTPNEVIKTLMKKKETDNDKSAVLLATAVLSKYLDLWSKDNYKEMRPLWYDWTLTDRSSEPMIKPKIQKISESVNILDETIIDFKLTFFLGLAKDIKGSFVMIKEDGNWKVRIASIEFYK
jgi:hypothetical protein